MRIPGGSLLGLTREPPKLATSRLARHSIPVAYCNCVVTSSTRGSAPERLNPALQESSLQLAAASSRPTDCRLWKESANRRMRRLRPPKTSAFLGVAQVEKGLLPQDAATSDPQKLRLFELSPKVEKGHGGLFPRKASVTGLLQSIQQSAGRPTEAPCTKAARPPVPVLFERGMA